MFTPLSAMEARNSIRLSVFSSHTESTSSISIVELYSVVRSDSDLWYSEKLIKHCVNNIL